MIASIWSAACTIRPFISNARCASINVTSSSIICTFDDSRKPCRNNPRPFSPGVPLRASPESAVAA